jgi:dimethylargininase
LYTHAITRKPGANFDQGLTTSNLGKPSYELITLQHEAYIETLKTLGLEVTVMDPLPEHPDAYFVEDTAIVARDVAIITLPGAADRRGEIAFIESILARYRPVLHIHPPGTMDGGDVLMIDKHFYIGISERTNQAGAEQLGSIVARYGNTWETVPVQDGLHLKSSVNYIGKNTLLLSQKFAGLAAFSKYEQIIVDQADEYACNTLWINDCLIMPKGFPNTRKRFEILDMKIIELEVSEVRKMDGGLTCMSLRF